MNGFFDAVVVGGGLGGLVSALLLQQSGREVALVEKRRYPFHKVCGEYVSNETRDFFRQLGMEPEALGAAEIRHLEVTSPSGHRLEAPLPLGGFGISRYTLDEALYHRCRSSGVADFTGRKALSIAHRSNHFGVSLEDGTELETGLVVGSWGKRTPLDAQLDRPFMRRQEPYVAVKYHVVLDFPRDRIALHNFPGGYCGLSAVENNRYCLCYLTTREAVRTYGTLEATERQLLQTNPHLRAVWSSAEFLYPRPEVINAFSFARKETVTQGIWNVGDVAGLITPLCGNGMAMAVHGAMLLASTVAESGMFRTGQLPSVQQRTALESVYTHRWRHQFARRLWVGRALQRWLFGNETAIRLAIQVLRQYPRATQQLIRLTHGDPF